MWTKNIDKRLLILQVLYRYYEKNRITEIRYGILKELRDDRLNYETNGEQEAYGGSFERHLKYLIDKDLVKRVSKGKKLTMIISNIKKIEHAIEESKLNESLDRIDKKIIDSSFEDDAWQETIEKVFGSAMDGAIKDRYNITPEVLNTEMIHRSYSLMKESIVKPLSNIMSRSFDFNFLPSDKNMNFDRELMLSVVYPAVKIAYRNQKAPFKITIEYHGIPKSDIEAQLKFEPAFLRIRTEYFVKWAHDVLTYDIEEDDKKKLNEGQYYLLSKSTKEIYDIFNESFLNYTEMLQSSTGPEMITL
jgi:hypothetical protein